MATANGYPTGTTTFARVMNSQTNSRFLSLARELRNRIYDFIFHRGDRGTSLELGVATSPDRNLGLTCQAMYPETHKAYAAGFRNFCTETPFKITCAADLDGREECKKKLAYLYNLDHVRIHHMRRFTPYRTDDGAVR